MYPGPLDILDSLLHSLLSFVLSLCILGAQKWVRMMAYNKTQPLGAAGKVEHEPSSYKLITGAKNGHNLVTMVSPVLTNS